MVLLLLGLAAALVAPVLRLPASRPSGEGGDPEEALGRAADAARALALRRGESLALAVAADGRWTVTPAAVPSTAAAPLLAGRVAAGAPLRVLVSPVGTCVPDATGTPPGSAAAVWDAARCRPVAAAPRAR